MLCLFQFLLLLNRILPKFNDLKQCFLIYSKVKNEETSVMETVVCSTVTRALVEKTLNHRLVNSTACRDNDLKDIHSQVQWLLLPVGLDLSQTVSINPYMGTFSYDPGFFLAWWSQEKKEMSLSSVQIIVTPWMVTHQVPLSMGFSRQEYWSRLSFPSPGDLSDPGIEPRPPILQVDSLLSKPPGKSRGGLRPLDFLRGGSGLHHWCPSEQCRSCISFLSESC